MTGTAPSAMAREIAETVEVTERLLAARDTLDDAAAAIRRAPPRLVVVCGRGSSGHAATYLRYLVETRLGLPTADAMPSVVTAYDANLDLRDSLFIAMSQSGASPDLLATVAAAKSGGAITLAIVNDTGSALASAVDILVPMHAGPEASVAATKSVVAGLFAGALLVAELARADDLADAAKRVPQRARVAASLDWSPWVEALASASAAFVVGRGYAFGPAQEIALKAIETLGLPALAYSAAELRHGPITAVNPARPVLMLRQADTTASALDSLGEDLRARGVSPFVAGGSQATLPWLGDDHPAFDPVLMLIPAYRAIEAAARAMGRDPDRPPHLAKVTRTL